MQHTIARAYDPVTGFTDEMYYDDVDGKIHVVRLQDVEHQLRQNQRQLDKNGKGFHNIDGFYHKATIPNAYIEKWLIEDGFNWFRSTDTERRQKLRQHPEFFVKKGKL